MKAFVLLSLLIFITACQVELNENTNQANDSEMVKEPEVILEEADGKVPEKILEPEEPVIPEPTPEAEPEPPAPKDTQYTGYILSGSLTDGVRTCVEDTIIASRNPYEHSTNTACEKAHKNIVWKPNCNPPACVQDPGNFEGFVFKLEENKCIPDEYMGVSDPYDFHNENDCNLYYSIKPINAKEYCGLDKYCLRNAAIGAKDASICEEIKKFADRSIKIECLKKVAELSQDTTVCDKLTYHVDVSECKTYIEIAKGNTDAIVCDQITSVSKIPDCLEHLAVLLNDESYCNLIEFDYDKDDCKAAVTVNS